MSREKIGFLKRSTARRLALGSKTRQVPLWGNPPVLQRFMCRFELTEDIGSSVDAETGPTTKIYAMAKADPIATTGILVNVDGQLNGARAGFLGQCWYEGGKFYFVQGDCSQICKSNVSIDAEQTPDDATIGQTDYAWAPTLSGGTANAGSWTATGLPTNWSIDADTGEITGPDAGDGGVAGPAGSLTITIQATAPKSTGAGNCTLTRTITIEVVAAP